ncbi:putative MFS family arabinose efflux permease [Kribbella pratensis]|uniref:MFS family arabinose efflux permease n=1 Tax=Kribbella pratensis TaxID=2512112 RepID=A0A4R8BVY3_9ACTN|nr:putative MFS family arabinose efflux permease [Kribbella pratensis]
MHSPDPDTPKPGPGGDAATPSRGNAGRSRSDAGQTRGDTGRAPGNAGQARGDAGRGREENGGQRGAEQASNRLAAHEQAGGGMGDNTGGPGGRSGSSSANGRAERPGTNGPGPTGGSGKAAGERLSDARERVGSAGKKVGHASKVGAEGVASASKKAAEVSGKVGRATGRRIRGLTSAQGAGESGLSRLIELGAVNAAGDTAFAVSLAGTVFFTVPSDQARDRVALFLLLTMAPFALMAPLIGPILDRFRHGRRWAIGATLGVRAFLVWSLASSIAGHGSAWLYPAALGCLVASKAYGVTRASAVPRLLPKQITLVTANSRISLAGVAGATIGAGIAAAFAAIGPQWSLRWAALVYIIGLILAIRLPSAVDSPADEEVTGTAGRAARRRAITAAVSRGIRCNLGLRFVSGFLTMYLAFLLRDQPISGVKGAVAAGAVIAAAGIGNSLGTLLGSLLKARKPEAVVLAVLLADAIVAVAVAVLYGLPILVALGLVAGLCSALGKLSLDAMIQRDVPESVRTSVFARSETVLQLAWVIGGGCGIVMPLIPRLGFGFLAAVLVVVVFLVLRMRPAPRPTEGPLRPGGLGGPRAGAHPHEHDTTSYGGRSESTTRTILTTSVAEQRANRARRSDSGEEPTIEWRGGDQPPADRPTDQHPGPTRHPEPGTRPAPDTRSEPGRRPEPGRSAEPGRRPQPPAGKWWSGQPDEDEDTQNQAAWAEEPTEERNRGSLFKRRPGTDNHRHPPR